MLEELRSKEREAFTGKKYFSGRAQHVYKKARANLQEEITEKKIGLRHCQYMGV